MGSEKSNQFVVDADGYISNLKEHKRRGGWRRTKSKSPSGCGRRNR